MTGHLWLSYISGYRLLQSIMERQAKPFKLEPIPATLSGPFDPTRSNKDTHLSKFRLSHASDRHHKTEPSVQNLREQLPKKLSKNRTEFSQEYMSLVNKLRVNLSKQLTKQARVEVFQQRQYLFNNQNRQKTPFLTKDRPVNTHQHYPRESLKVSNLKKRSFTTFSKEMEFGGAKTFRNYESALPDQSFYKNSQEGFRKDKSSYLPSMNTFQKGRYELNEVIKQVTEQNSPEKPKKKSMCKPKSNRKSKSKEKPVLIFKSGQQVPHLHAGQQTADLQLKQLSEDYSKIDELCFHIEVLIDILQKMNSAHNVQESPDKLIKVLNDYVLGNKKLIPPSGRLLLDDISHLDRMFTDERNRKHMRTLIFYERILIISCIDLLANRVMARHQHTVNTIFHSLLGTYLYLIYLRSQAKAPLPAYAQNCLSVFHAKTSEHNIHVKRELQTTVYFVSKKVFPLLKANQGLFRQIKLLVGQFESRNVTINRSFYELLRLFAVYLNNHENLLEKHYQTLKTFATCPSPYLTKPPSKRYTLVLDLDQTLIHSQRQKQRLQIFMRPFLKEFLQVMSRNYQIVIFTSSMPDYSEQIIAELPYISHRLYRYHTTRLKHRHIKDLARLGRPLESVVMVDNEEDNFVLQKQNGIRIVEWRGNDPLDQELNILGVFLNQLASKEASDLREHIPLFKEFRSNYKKP